MAIENIYGFSVHLANRHQKTDNTLSRNFPSMKSSLSQRLKHSLYHQDLWQIAGRMAKPHVISIDLTITEIFLVSFEKKGMHTQ